MVNSTATSRERPLRSLAGARNRGRAVTTELAPRDIADIPLVALERHHAPIAGELRAAFERVLGASGFVLGQEVARFEAEFAAYCGVEHCVGVASGTAAVAIALEAAGIGPGDEVVVPAHTFIASALGVLHAGAQPVLCDVDDETGLIDPVSAEMAVGPRTAAILAVHLYGQPADMDRLAALAERRGLALVEDAAQAHGATWNGRRAGALGHAAAFSFYPSKNLGALGDGGAVCTGDATVASRARMLRDLGQRRKGEHALAGRNDRLDGLQAAFLRVKLPRLDAANAARRAHAAAYREGLAGSVRLLPERAGAECVHHLQPARVVSRAEVARRLRRRGIATGVHYYPALHGQPPLAQLERRVALDTAEAWAREELSLPMFAELTHEEIERVVVTLREVL